MSRSAYAFSSPLRLSAAWQRRLHPHVLELGDGEVEVLDDGSIALLGVLVEGQLGETGAREG